MVRAERGGGDKGGGGLCILYKDTLTPHHWIPKVEDRLKYVENERQWLLVDNGSQKCAMLHCYVACQSVRNDNFIQWNEDLFELMTSELVRLGTFLPIGLSNLLSGRFESVQTDYYSYEFVLRKLEARV